jgi:hypothetical protein
VHQQTGPTEIENTFESVLAIQNTFESVLLWQKMFCFGKKCFALAT